MKTSVIILFFLAVFLLTGNINGQDKNLPGPARGRLERFRQSPGALRGKNFEPLFTTEQRDAVKAIRLKTQKEMKPLKDKLRELAAHHISLTTAEKADLTAINASIDKIGEVKTAMAKIMAKEHQEIRALLTEEQRVRFDRMRPALMERHRRNRFSGPALERPGAGTPK
jgi:hypothetical protein